MTQSLPDLSTLFAPAERGDPGFLRGLAEELLRNPVAQAILESVAGYVVILDSHRQILAANRELELLLDPESKGHLLLKRPGEAVGCIHAKDGPGGCGTGPNCAHCGAVLSILASQSEGIPDTRECLLSMAQGEKVVAGEFKVRSTPVHLEGQDLTVFLLQDISASKRKEALESVFFHDVLNLVGGLQGASHLMTLTPEHRDELSAQILDLSGQLAQEILSQRLLMSAEQGDLTVDPKPVRPDDMLKDLAKVFLHHEVALEREFTIEPAPEAMLQTDPVLLSRVLVNMVKNGLEACPKGKGVRLSFSQRGGRPTVEVHNPGHMPTHVQDRIFQRSFSTKALKGRGLGTYSMKIFGERYLGGQVGFSTSEAEGTTFFLALPMEAWVEQPTAEPPRLTSAAPTPQPAQALPPPEPPRAAETLRRRGRLLLVDDSRTVLAILSKVLGEEYDITTASSGEMALERLETYQPDLILLDVVMPGLDGLEVCTRLKADDRTRDIPVLFLSGMSQEQDEAIGLSLGAIDYIHKPISPAIVKARVKIHMELKQYRDTLREMSYVDGLTGIPNRRRFEDYFDQEWRRALRQQRPLSLAMIDIDHFKTYNDTYGHLEGDACLRDVAQALQRGVLRVTDLVARYGGEEFVVVMPDTEGAGATQVVERLLEGVRALKRPHARSTAADHVTVSLGLATWTPTQGDRPEALQQAADRQLYRAKEEGRNRAAQA